MMQGIETPVKDVGNHANVVVPSNLSHRYILGELNPSRGEINHYLPQTLSFLLHRLLELYSRPLHNKNKSFQTSSLCEEGDLRPQPSPMLPSRALLRCEVRPAIHGRR